MRISHFRSLPKGFTLLELLLALGLTAVVSILIGGLVQLFLVNETRGRDTVRQAQMARAILNMIAEDIRATVRYYPYDTSGLDQMLGSAMNNATGGALGALTGAAGGGLAGGGATGGGATGGAATGGAAGGGSGGAGNPSAGGSAGGAGASGGGLSGSAIGSMAGGGAGGQMTAGAGATGSPAAIPPGIFGAASSIEIDVSRLPRPDEYVIQPGNINTGSLGDMPSDIKTVGYYVQAPRSDGVQDPLSSLTSQIATATSSSSGLSGGLVRRSLDRAVTQYAYEVGNSDQLMRTGEIIAPEVLGIDFSYFGPEGWRTDWDSSTLGLPSVVKVTIAMQRESSARTNPMAPGISLSMLNASMMQEYGIELYSMNILIPGAALLPGPTSSTTGGTSSNGMSSLGL